MYQDIKNISQEIKAQQARFQAETHHERLVKECGGLEQPARKTIHPARKPFFRLALCPRSAR